MAKYVYPAIFTKEENGCYSIVFPDLEGCYTTGDSLVDGIYMAEDVLAFTLYSLEKGIWRFRSLLKFKMLIKILLLIL